VGLLDGTICRFSDLSVERTLTAQRLPLVPAAMSVAAASRIGLISPLLHGHAQVELYTRDPRARVEAVSRTAFGQTSRRCLGDDLE